MVSQCSSSKLELPLIGHRSFLTKISVDVVVMTCDCYIAHIGMKKWAMTITLCILPCIFAMVFWMGRLKNPSLQNTWGSWFWSLGITLVIHLKQFSFVCRFISHVLAKNLLVWVTVVWYKFGITCQLAQYNTSLLRKKSSKRFFHQHLNRLWNGYEHWKV